MLKTLLKQLRDFKRPAIITPICMVAEVVCEMLIPLMMASIIDKGVEAGDMNHIVSTGMKMLLMALCALLAGVLGGKFAARASTGFAHNLREAMFDRIQNFSFSNIDKFSTASLVTRLTTDVTNIQNAFQMILRMFVRAPMSMITAMTLAFLINARLATIYLIAVAILSVIAVFIMKKATRYFKKIFPRYDDLNESIDENVTGIRVVKAYAREDYETEKEKKASGMIYKLFTKAENILVGVAPIMTGTIYTCILLISWIGAKMIVADGLSTGQLMSLLTYCMNILMSLMMVAVVLVMITMSQASAERICEVLNEEPDLKNPENPDFEIPDGSVDFSDVSFRYYKASEEPVLDGINLSIRSGETIGIIGGTGSAKTTLVNLISRLYDVDEGSVKVGGKDVRTYDLATLRDAVAVVLQKNVLFAGTILENLRWGNADATEEECREACRLACADEFIETFPEGYETVLEQGGTNVSGGQRQRLCIARALLKRPKILVLDDSTSAVDTATEAKIRKAFAEYIPETTKIIIAQRISSVEKADRVIVMENGCVHGFDTPARLLETDEIYREVQQSQAAAGDFDEGGDA